MTSYSIFTHYDKDLPVQSVCYASKVGLGAVLVHVIEDGAVKTIAHASRLLSKSKRNYSQKDKL